MNKALQELHQKLVDERTQILAIAVDVEDATKASRDLSILQGFYDVLARRHNSQSNGVYSCDEIPIYGTAMQRVEQVLKDLRAKIRESASRDGNLNQTLNTAIATREALSQMKHEHDSDIFEEVFANYQIKNLAFPMYLASHWGNDLAAWCDKVIGGKQ